MSAPRPLILLGAVWIALCAAVLPARAESVLVFAAASLGTALAEIASDYREQTGTGVVISAAGSSALARQIEIGAPADLFISADRDWMDHLITAGRVGPENRVDLLGNRLALIGRAAPAAPVDLLKALPEDLVTGRARLATALIDAVPAGRYAHAALTSLGYWDTVAPRVVQSDNVRTALALVAAGAAPYGIVYATDAATEPRVTTLALFPAGSHPPITYPAALIGTAPNPAAQDFFGYLQGADAAAVFADHGFGVLPKPQEAPDG